MSISNSLVMPKSPPVNLALPIDGIRSGLIGTTPMDRSYMAGIRARARMLARACAVKQSNPNTGDSQSKTASKR